MSVVIGAIEGPSDMATCWSDIDWSVIRRHVSRLQIRIVKAIKADQWHRARSLQRLLANSFYAKLLAVERISSNRGKHTHGVDGVVLKTPQSKWQQAQKLGAKDYKPQPLRRPRRVESAGH
jgi:RNA-directed DNA polymerase